MTEDQRKQYEESAKEYAECFKTGEWFESIRIKAVMWGCEYAHSKIEEAEREAYNRACNNIIDMISDSSAFGLVDANGTIEKIEKLRK